MVADRGRLPGAEVAVIDDIEIFLAVVESAGFSAAARRLDSTPAAVSRRIKALEQRLGVRLLQRTTRKVALTEAGQRYRAEVEQVVARLREAEARLAVEAGAVTGELRVVAPMSFGQRRLAPVIARFARAYPGLRISLLLDDSQTDIVAAGVDLAIRIAYPEDSSLVGRALADVSLVCCAAPAYLAERGTPRVPQDLRGHACLHYNLVSEREEWTFADGAPVAVRGVFCSNNGDVLAAAAVAGLGITVLPGFIVEDDIAAGRLQPILVDHRRPPLTLSVLYPSRRHLPSKVRLFIEYLREHLGGPSA